jgi:hypothetical protein
MRLNLTAMVAAAALAGSLAAHAEPLKVYHGSVPAPTVVDNGVEGQSAGDQRIWHFDGTTEDGATVKMEWVMMTTAMNTPEDGVESRVTTGIFSFQGDDLDQIVIEGVGLYPSTGSTFKPSMSLARAILGGTGAYAGARGEVITTHFADDSWVHEFHFSDASED